MIHNGWRAIAAAAFAIGLVAAAAPAQAGPTVDKVKQAGSISCGVQTGVAGYAQPDSQGVYTGFNIDICHALSAALFGASPEMLVRVTGDAVETRPIAGTLPRGATREADFELEQRLLVDPKERAEHLMLVDLGRNDLGRVCAGGSVEVSNFCHVERYSHVMHLVTDVRGRLRGGRTPVDALLSAFPAGTLSGAPKIRAMELIDRFEPTRRGPYGGAVAYFSFSGNLDSCITIRTIVLADGRASIQAGAGIVYDSVPSSEYDECVNKSMALRKAIAMARSAGVPPAPVGRLARP
jgi:anthranilate synthase component 1